MLFLNLSCKMLLLLALFVETGFIIGAAAMHVALRHSKPPERKARRLKYATYFLITHFMLLAACAHRPVFLVVIAVLTASGSVELMNATAQRRPPRSVAALMAFGLYFAASTGTILFAANSSPGALVFVYLIICILDAYSQITGQLIGAHRAHGLAPSISPQKTIEGAAGGALCAILTALVFRDFAGLGYTGALECGILLSCAGILGDLLASRYKRLCGIKDYSKLLPGQGGIIDRFNSFFAAAPVFFLFTLMR
jgi:phosphatidate cytidylyltransferase